MDEKVIGSPSWESEWEVVGDDSPSALSSVARHGARTLARVGETALGLPGDVANLALSGANLAQRPFTGQWSPEIAKIQESNPFTSRKLRENITQPLEKNVLPEGYLTPQSKGEELADNFVSDLTSILAPTGALGLAGKGAKLTKGALASAAATSGLGNLAGWATKKLGGSEQTGDLVKVGTMLGVSLAGVPRMRDAASKLYDKVEQLIPESLNVSTEPLINVVGEAKKLIQPHASTRGGKALSDYLNDTLLNIAKEGEQKLKTILELDKGFNKVVSQNPAIAYDVKKARDLVREAIDKTIKQSGRPDIVKSYRSAQTLYREASRASEAQDWAKQVAHSLPSHGNKFARYTKMLLGLPAQGAKALHATGEGIEEAIRLFNIPEVRGYWTQAGKAAFGKSRPAWIKAAHMLDKSVQKHEVPETGWQSQWEVID